MNSYNGFLPAQRMKALGWLKKEYAAGRRQRPTVCDACGQTSGVLEAHSEDYSFPFGDNIGAFGLCYRCHMILHCRFRNRDAFTDYWKTLRSGCRFEAMHSRSFPLFTRQHLASRTAPQVQVGQTLPGFAALLAAGREAMNQHSGQCDLFE